MSKLSLGQRVVSTWGYGKIRKGTVVYRPTIGYAAGFEHNGAVADVASAAVDDDDFLVLHDSGEVGYGFDGDGDYEAIED